MMRCCENRHAYVRDTAGDDVVAAMIQHVFMVVRTMLQDYICGDCNRGSGGGA
jgi:hypothetical protein